MPPERSKCRTSIDGLALPTPTIWECSGKEPEDLSNRLCLYVFGRIVSWESVRHRGVSLTDNWNAIPQFLPRSHGTGFRTKHLLSCVGREAHEDGKPVHEPARIVRHWLNRLCSCEMPDTEA